MLHLGVGDHANNSVRLCEHARISEGDQKPHRQDKASVKTEGVVSTLIRKEMALLGERVWAVTLLDASLCPLVSVVDQKCT